MKVSQEQLEKNRRFHAEQTATWGVERRPFESDVSYWRRVAAHWKEVAESHER